MTDLVAETEETTVLLDAYNTIGDNHVMVLPFDTPVALEKDSAYLVVVGSYDGPENVLFPLSGESPELTSFVKFFPNSWFYMVNTPMVRMNFGVVTNIENEQEELVNTLEVYPNPTANNTQVAFELEAASNTRMAIYNANGKAVRHRVFGSLPSGKHKYQIDLDDLSTGMYIVQLISDRQKIEQVLIKE